MVLEFDYARQVAARCVEAWKGARLSVQTRKSLSRILEISTGIPPFDLNSTIRLEFQNEPTNSEVTFQIIKGARSAFSWIADQLNAGLAIRGHFRVPDVALVFK